MKKLLTCISFLLVIAMLSACQANNVENINSSSNEIGKNAEQPTDAKKEPVKYVMYTAFSTGEGESSQIDSARPDIELKTSTEKEFNISGKELIAEPLKSTSEVKQFKILGKTYESTYARSYKTIFSSSNSKMSGTINQYIADKLVVEFFGDTNDISLFMDTSIDNKAEGSLSKDQAISKAKEVIESVYGITAANSYVFEASLDESLGNKLYRVTCLRYVYGFKTCDEVIINFNMKGELSGIGATKSESMASAEQDLTKEEIDNAIKAVNEKFSAAWTVSNDHYIVIDSNGDYYLRTNIARSLDKTPSALQIYTNIQ